MGGTITPMATVPDRGRCSRGRIVTVDPLPISLEIELGGGLKLICDKPSPARAVMLHLRARYVSKAAILTVPAPLAPGENRSPA